MKIAKQSDVVNFNTEEPEQLERYVSKLDEDVAKLFLATQSRLRFGGGTDGDTGENISGQYQQFTTSGTAGAENTVAHSIGSVPKGRIIMWQDKPGSLSQGPTTGTNWTTTNVYFACESATVTFNVFLIK